MDTVRDGLRDNELDKDTFDRLVCQSCDRPLKKRDDPDSLWAIRFCTDCGTEWREMR